jgi:hypothetical protein
MGTVKSYRETKTRSQELITKAHSKGIQFTCVTADSYILKTTIHMNVCFFVYFLRDEPGIMRELLPDIPATIICIPVISSAIAIINATNLTPSAGDAIINMPKTISSAPTPILNHLDQLWLSLSLNPCITLEMPFIKSATPISIIRNIVVPNGNAVTIIASMITNIPRPTLVHRDDLLLRNIPVIMVSIPTISKRIPTKNTIDATASPGKASMYIDKTTEIAPNPI